MICGNHFKGKSVCQVPVKIKYTPPRFAQGVIIVNNKQGEGTMLQIENSKAI